MQDEYRESGFILHANFHLPKPFEKKLVRCLRFIVDGKPEDTYDGDKLAELLALQQECRVAWNEVVTADIAHYYADEGVARTGSLLGKGDPGARGAH